MPRREDHEVRQGHVGHWIKKKKFLFIKHMVYKRQIILKYFFGKLYKQVEKIFIIIIIMLVYYKYKCIY